MNSLEMKRNIYINQINILEKICHMLIYVNTQWGNDKLDSINISANKTKIANSLWKQQIMKTRIP